MRSEPQGLLPLLIALPYSAGAFTVTWSLIFAFFSEYLTRFGCDAKDRFSLFTCDTEAWFASPGGDTFVEAYVQVTNTPGGWIWSSTLLMFVVPCCLWIHLEGTRSGLSRAYQLAFIVLGFLGAISASFPLAFAFVNALQHQKKLPNTKSASLSFHRAPVAKPRINFTFLALPAALAIASAVALPYTVHKADRTPYITALAILHVILLVPTLCNKIVAVNSKSKGVQNGTLVIIYAAISGAAAVQHLHNLLQYASGESPWSELGGAGWANYCQASISWDACLSGAACLGFLWSSAKRERNADGQPAYSAMPFILASPFVSIAATFAAFLACSAAKVDTGTQSKTCHQKENKKTRAD
mmetsp:Transcript_52567/g.105326  ORF Transcript_52567/g.105326 Transcript_52567/m.105326 type:complete len:356 (-) Transcript_52567:53-1120(-)